MPGECFVDVTYRGLELGRRLKVCELGPTTAYLEHATPMPVGAPLEIVTDEGLRLPVRVLRVHEQVGGAERAPGMRIVPLALDDAARAWWDAHVVGPDLDVPGPPVVGSTAVTAPSVATVAAGDVVSGGQTLQMPAMTDEINDGNGSAAPACSDGVPADAGDGRRTQVMAAVEIQAIVDHASAPPRNGQAAAAVAAPESDDGSSSDSEDGDPAASGALTARGKQGKKKRRRK